MRLKCAGVCVLARASRISAILWENDTAPQTGKVSKQRSRAEVVKLCGANTQKKKTLENFDPLM